MRIGEWTELVETLTPRLGRLRVGVYGSGGAPFHHLALAALFGAAARPVTAEAIRSGGLEGFDVLVVPGGGVLAMSGLLSPLGEDGARAVRRWVDGGGMYVGSCAGSFLPAAVGESFWTENPQARQMCMVNAQLFNRADSEWAGLTSPGVGTVHVRTERPRHWLARGLPPHFRIVHYNGPMFEARPGEPPESVGSGGSGLGEVTGVVRFLEATEDFTPGEAFLSPARATPTLFDSGVAGGAYSVVVGPYGRGTVVLFGSHPEFGLDAIQLGWDDGVRLFANALARQAASGEDRAGDVDAPRGAGGVPTPPGAVRALGEAARLAAGNAGRFHELAVADPGAWAVPGRVARFLGMEPTDLWRRAATDASAASSDTAAYLSRLAATPGSVDEPELVDRWLLARAPEGQDYGFAGLIPLLERAGGMASVALEAMSTPPFGLSGPYDGMDRHPYQLAVSSYLSAAGLAASGLLSAVALGRLLGDRTALPVPRLLA